MVTFGYALFLAVIIGIIASETYGYIGFSISFPVFGGALIGLIMGDLRTGLIVGGTVQLMYVGVLMIGAAIPPNAPMAGLIGTALAILAGGKPEVGITLAIPIGLLVQLLLMLAWTVNVFIVHKADTYCAEGNTRKIELTHLTGLIVFFLAYFIPAFLAIYYGSPLVAQFVKIMPEWLTAGLNSATGMLPAVGMAMLLRMMDFKRYWPFFLIGFVAAVYLKLSVLPVALIGVGIAVAIFVMNKSNSVSEVASKNVDTNNKTSGLIDSKMLKRVYWRTHLLQATINYERFQNLGWNYALMPVLKKLYPDKEKLKEALVRHNEFFNCHEWFANPILGITMAMEEQRANGMEVSGEAITATKAAFMGPLAGMGDSLIQGTFLTLFAVIGASAAMKGNWFGPILFIVPAVLGNVFVRYYGLVYGYNLGANLIARVHESDILQKIVEGATIVGLLVVGVMVRDFVRLNLSIVATFGGAKIVIQDLLDSVLPSMLPLGLTLWFYAMLRKNRSIYILLAICFILGILGRLFLLVQ